MLDSTTITRLSNIVDAAQSAPHLMVKLSDQAPGMTIADGYAVQDELASRWQARGRRIVGYKAGLTSRAKMVQMGIEAPVFGLLTHDMAVPEGAEVPFAGLLHPRVEAELAVVLKAGLSGADRSEAEIAAAIDFVQPALEIIDSRYENFRFDLPSVIADNTSSARYVLGGRACRVADLDLHSTGIVMEKNGRLAAAAATGAVLGNPLRAVGMLSAWLAGRGRSLPAGAVILTGGATEALPLAAGDVITARYQGLGAITVRFS